MNEQNLYAGAAQCIITPPIGVYMAGWHHRAAGDNIARYVHDDLYVKALVMRCGEKAWAWLATDLVGVDAVATARIRHGIAQQTQLASDAILICATHCHSGPVVGPVALATDPEELARSVVRADGTVAKSYGKSSSRSSGVFYVGETDLNWKERFVNQAIEAAVQAWQSMRPAEVAFGQTEATGVASSRRLLLSDGSWADPRRDASHGTDIVSRTEIDPFVRVLLLRDAGTKAPLAAVINYGSHPWIFSISGLSAEVAGATADAVAANWGASATAPPVVLYTAGPEGDVTLIWNIDIEHVWKTREGETPEESLVRRERAFEDELARLGTRLAESVMRAIVSVERWDDTPEINSRRQEVALPLKQGYQRPAEVSVADWQEAAPQSHHLTEIQVLQVGKAAILALPGEPFASIGQAIRDRCRYPNLIIAALANDFGAISYIAHREAFELGGYELTHTPLAAGSGEILVAQAADLLNASY